MMDDRLDLAMHLTQVVLALLGAWYLVRKSSHHATSVRARLDDVTNRAVANVEIEAQEVRGTVAAAETAVRETAETTDAKIDQLAEKLEEK